jgi:hypothetical protein
MIPKNGNRFSDQTMRTEKVLGAFATVSRRVEG